MDKKTKKTMIRRKSYIRKSYNQKDEEDKGKKGKGKKLFEIKDEGFLRENGYSLKNSKEKRHNSLREASKEKGMLKVLQHLNAIRTLQKSNIENYNKLDKDVKYLQKEYRKNK